MNHHKLLKRTKSKSIKAHSRHYKQARKTLKKRGGYKKAFVPLSLNKLQKTIQRRANKLMSVKKHKKSHKKHSRKQHRGGANCHTFPLGLTICR